MVQSLSFDCVRAEVRAKVLYFYTVNKDMRKEVIGISFTISMESFQNVTMNNEHSSKTNQVLNSDLGGRAPSGAPCS